MILWHWIFHVAGVDNLSGPWYGFWSGLGSDISEFALVGGGIALARAHTCHVQGCWRWGKHPAGIYKFCAKHHPDIPPGG